MVGRPGTAWAPARAGFSMVEVALAVLLLGLAMVPLFLLFRQGATGTVQTRDEVVAYGLASDLLHLAKGLAFDDPLLAPGERPVGALIHLDGAVPPDPRFSRSLAVTDARATGDTVPYRYKVLAVRVTWESGGVARAVRMSGLVFRGRS